MNTDKKGTLYLIPVPLSGGQAADILAPVVLQKVGSVRVFIVEEIRTARRFLRNAGYQGDFSDVTFHILNEHTADEDTGNMLHQLLSGQDAGLLSEAGVPCIADPGNKVVAQAHRKNISVVPLPGPSSVLLALMASGFNGQNFCFHGYLPVKNHDRTQKIKDIEAEMYKRDQTQIFIETPYRNKAMIETLIQTCKDQTMLCIAANISAEDEFICSRSIGEWKKHAPELHKVPAVFLLYR